MQNILNITVRRLEYKERQEGIHANYAEWSADRAVDLPDPMIVPVPISLCVKNVSIRAVKSSGADVPAAIKLAP